MLLASLLAVPLERPGIIELLLAPVILVFSVIPESAMQRMSDAAIFWAAMISVVVGWALVWLILASVFFRLVRRRAAQAPTL